MQHPPRPVKASDTTKAAPGDVSSHLIDVTLESMAPMHATGNAALLSDVRPAPPGQEPFGVLPVVALGRLATPRFDVPDFRHVPGLGDRTAVVCVGQLAERGFVVGFGAGGTCHVTDVSTGKRVGKGRARGGRYYLDYLKLP